MWERLFRKLTKHRKQDYYRALQRYRREHPESIEEERKQIKRWLAFVEAHRQDTQTERESPTNGHN
jgi:hypothetical protein